MASRPAATPRSATTQASQPTDILIRKWEACLELLLKDVPRQQTPKDSEKEEFLQEMAREYARLGLSPEADVFQMAQIARLMAMGYGTLRIVVTGSQPPETLRRRLKRARWRQEAVLKWTSLALNHATGDIVGDVKRMHTFRWLADILSLQAKYAPESDRAKELLEALKKNRARLLALADDPADRKALEASLERHEKDLSTLVRRPAATSRSATAPVSATKQIVLAVERLAGDATQASVAFAVKLTTVLAKHKVALPEALRRLAAPKPPVPKPTAAQVSRIYRQTHRMFSICVESTRAKVVHSGVSVSLRNDLLITVAKHCPSSLARVEAVVVLGKRAVPSGGDEVPDVSAVEASKAFEAVIMHVLDVSSGNLGPDSIPAIRWAESFGLCPYSVHLKAITSDKPTKDALDKYVAAIDAKVAAAQKVVRGESARKTLERFRVQVKMVGSGTKLMVQVASLTNEVRPVVKAFLAAANKEDFAAVQKLTTKKTFAQLPKKKPSLRALIANSPKVKEVRFVSLGAIGTLGSQYLVPVHILIVDANGKSRAGVWNARLTKTDAGWRFGE